MRTVVPMPVRASYRAVGFQRGPKQAAPWRWTVSGRTLAVILPTGYRVLSWAPLGGGLRHADLIVNHQIEKNDRAAAEAPLIYLGRLLRAMGHDRRAAVAMMTGASVANAAYACARGPRYLAGAWCTAGASNALRVGDPARVETTAPGTINLIVAVSQPLSRAAMVEAVQIAVEARVLAVQSARLRSVRSGRFATGTGTDCVAVASPAPIAAARTQKAAKADMRVRPEPYCGKHTRLGELIGRAVLKSCGEALARRAN